MKEKQNPSLPNWSKALLGLLFIAVATEGYYLYRLTAEKNNGDLPAAELAVAGSTAPPSAMMPAMPLQQQDPFDSQDWDPMAEMQRMRQQMDAMFNNAFGHMQQGNLPGMMDTPLTASPQLDLKESDQAYDVAVDLPGADQADIKTSLEGQILSIKAETDQSSESQSDQSGSSTIRKERWVGRFERSITLPQPVDASGMTTKYDNGVLRIHIPKAQSQAGTPS